MPVRLPPGSLLLMRHDTQDIVQHELLKDNTKGRRISITGRWILPSKSQEKKSIDKVPARELWEKVQHMNARLKAVVDSENRLKEIEKTLKGDLTRAKSIIADRDATIRKLKSEIDGKKDAFNKQDRRSAAGSGPPPRWQWEEKNVPRRVNLPQNSSYYVSAPQRQQQQKPRAGPDPSDPYPPDPNDPYPENKHHPSNPTYHRPQNQYSNIRGPSRGSRSPLDSSIDPKKYRTKTLIIKGLSSKGEPDTQWIQAQFADTGLFDEESEITSVTQFKSRMGDTFTRVVMQDEEAVTSIVRKRKVLKNANSLQLRKVKIFPHRPRVVREALIRLHPKRRYTPMKEMAFYPHPAPQDYLNWLARQQGWQPPRNLPRSPWY